jgi:hypothetical protein
VGEVPALEVDRILRLGTSVSVGCSFLHGDAAFKRSLMDSARKRPILGSRFGLAVLRDPFGTLPVPSLWRTILLP